MKITFFDENHNVILSGGTTVIADGAAGAAVGVHEADTTDAHDASAISYDNSGSGLMADDVQAAIDEIVASPGGTPASTVTDETTFGISPAVGTDTEYARQDHTHGSPANPVSGAALAALGFVGPVLIADDHSSPLVFDDLLQTEAGDDLLYADVGA